MFPAERSVQANMSLANLDIALRGAAIALLLVLAAALVRDAGRSVAGRLTVALAISAVAHAVTFNIGITAAVVLWHLPLIALSTGTAVVLWLFCRAMFDDGFVLRPGHALAWLAVTMVSFADCLWLAPAAGARFAIVANNLLALGFIVPALAQTVRSWPSDLVEGRRRLRAFVVAAAVLYGGTNALLQLMASGGQTIDVANAANAALLVLVVAALTVALLQVDTRDLFAAPAPPVAVPDPTSAADRKLIDALMRLMSDERIYRQENVTIGTLAVRLSIPEYRLRRLINQRLGYRNFNAFLNNHRIAEAKAALADPAQAEVPVITIAMDAGFQSLGPFNRAFKETTGVTPSEYRKKACTA
jgi:AraC-like DNA-binding protein